MSLMTWLKPSALAATFVVAGSLLVAMPAKAQDVTVLRGVQPQAQPTPAVDCNNPYYAQYCQAYNAWYNQYYTNNDDGDAYPYYYGYGIPVGVGLGFGFAHHGFGHHGGFHGGGFHSSGFHGGGFHGGGFHGGGFHGGGGGRR